MLLFLLFIYTFIPYDIQNILFQNGTKIKLSLLYIPSLYDPSIFGRSIEIESGNHIPSFIIIEVLYIGKRE